MTISYDIYNIYRIRNTGTFIVFNEDELKTVLKTIWDRHDPSKMISPGIDEITYPMNYPVIVTPTVDYIDGEPGRVLATIVDAKLLIDSINEAIASR